MFSQFKLQAFLSYIARVNLLGAPNAIVSVYCFTTIRLLHEFAIMSQEYRHLGEMTMRRNLTQFMPTLTHF